MLPEVGVCLDCCQIKIAGLISKGSLAALNHAALPGDNDAKSADALRTANDGQSKRNHVKWLVMRQIFAIAFVAFSAAAIASGQKQSAIRDPKRIVEQVIRKLDNERIQAQIHADAAALERIYADDFIGVGPSGTVRTKPQVISDFTSGDLKFQSITTDDVRVRVYGNAAVETGRSTMDGQDKGKAVPHDTRFTRVWIKQQGRWRLVANHYSSRVSHQ
jgi:ketosteroid isomerase-like protein